MNDAVIVSAVRTPVGKAPNGTLRGTRPDELAATVIAEALRRAPGLDAGEIDDVILGCAMPEGEQGLNVARIASLRAGVPVSASAVTINRFCSSGLQAIAFAAERIMCGFASAIVAGGTESMSLVPMGGNKLSPNPAPGRFVPGRLPEHGPGRRESRARVGHLARSAGRVRARAAISAAIAAIDARPLRRRNRAGHGAGRGREPGSGQAGRRGTWCSPPTKVRGATRRRGAGDAAAGVSRAWDGHGRQFVADERRRRRGHRHVRGVRARARTDAAGAVRRVCQRRRRA